MTRHIDDPEPLLAEIAATQAVILQVPCPQCAAEVGTGCVHHRRRVEAAAEAGLFGPTGKE